MRARRSKAKILSDIMLFTAEKNELPENSEESAPVCAFQEPKPERFSSDNLAFLEVSSVSSCAPSVSKQPNVVRPEEDSSFSSLGAEFNPKVVLVRLDETIVQKALHSSKSVVTSLHENNVDTSKNVDYNFLTTESAYNEPFYCKHCGETFTRNRRAAQQSLGKLLRCPKCSKWFKCSRTRNREQPAEFTSRKISSANVQSDLSSNNFSDLRQDCGETTKNSTQESVRQQSNGTTEKNETQRCAQLKVHFNNTSQVLSKKSSSLTHYRRQLRRSVTQRKAHATKRNLGTHNTKPCRNGVLSQAQQRRHLWNFVSSLCSKDMDKQDACQILIDTLAAHCSKEMIDKISFDNAERLMRGPSQEDKAIKS